LKVKAETISSTEDSDVDPEAIILVVLLGVEQGVDTAVHKRTRYKIAVNFGQF